MEVAMSDAGRRLDLVVQAIAAEVRRQEPRRLEVDGEHIFDPDSNIALELKPLAQAILDALEKG
jgi:hypothetical protein